MIREAYRKLAAASLCRKMSRDWDRRAQENALHYVNTGQSDWDEDAFFETGEQNFRDQIAPSMRELCKGRDPGAMRVLEIGCGVGRMTRALAARFGEVHGVDVSEEMVRRARHYLRSTSNAYLYRNSGRDLKVLGDLQFDFAYSFIVFQHIPSKQVIDGYVAEVGRVLRPGGVFLFQVQGYRGAELRLPSRSTWLGASISATEAEDMAARHGFQCKQVRGSGTQYFWLWFEKAEAM